MSKTITIENAKVASLELTYPFYYMTDDVGSIEYGCINENSVVIIEESNWTSHFTYKMSNQPFSIDTFDFSGVFIIDKATFDAAKARFEKFFEENFKG